MKALIVLLIVCLAVVSGCRARVFKPPKPPGVFPGVVTKAERGQALVATHTSGLDEGDRWTVVQSACLANDLLDLQQAPDFTAAVDQALITFGGYQTLYYRILDLAEDLRAESTQSERQVKVGVFVVCETT